VVQIKKIFLFVLSFVTAFILVELFLQYVIGFPTYSVEKKLTGIRGSASGTQNIFIPNSTFFNVEGGLQIYRRNNLGFTGLDVDTINRKEFIAILGNSYLEAYQVPPESTAVGILQISLQNGGSNYQVVNLGNSGHDPMDLLYRLYYYDQFFHFKKIILVIPASQSDWLNRQPSLKFSPQKIVENKAGLSKYLIPLRNHSVFLDLFAKTINAKEQQGDAVPEIETPQKRQKTELKYDAEYDNKLKQVVTQYNSLYPGKIAIINIGENELETIPDSTKNYILSSNIRYLWRPINKPINKINGKGHLNTTGNRELGKTLYELFKQD